MSQTGKKCRKRFSDFRKWFKRLCWLTRRSWTKFHQESHSSPSFPSARSLCEEKGFLQLVKWKNSCIFSFSLSFSLSCALSDPFSHLTFSPSTTPRLRLFGTATTFFLGFFLAFFPFLGFFFRLSSTRVTLWVHARRAAEVTLCVQMPKRYNLGTHFFLTAKYRPLIKYNWLYLTCMMMARAVKYISYALRVLFSDTWYVRNEFAKWQGGKDIASPH